MSRSTRDVPEAAIACYGAVKQFHKGDDGSHNVLLIVTANGALRLLVDIVSSGPAPPSGDYKRPICPRCDF